MEQAIPKFQWLITAKVYLLLTNTAADQQRSFPRVTQEFKSFLLAPSTLQDLPKVFFFLNSLHPASQGEERNSLEDDAPDI